MKRPAITAQDVDHALRLRYAAPAWAFLAQVRNGTGYDRAVAESTVPADDVAQRIAKAVEETQEQERRLVGEELKRLRSRFEEFEKASGVNLSERWADGEQIGEAVRLVLAHGREPARSTLARLREEARGTLAMLDALAKAADEVVS